ncbi:P97 family adhesin [Mesomycoplasma bovoculi]|uniref:p97/LppS family protein n=1 Tax=Mesomycoplasma bovoculi M165/69 TaxID=743966 RepID=W5USR1_9BACT|nr:hypothetical protein [Mesomycoplasma bovoculi]AHH45249.1 P97/LppS family protein [Mesomycoplasma bovoculi M165/69]
MKNKQIITLIGTTVAGVSVFGLAVGLATTVRYNSEDPKKAVTTFASSVANVSFNTQAFPIDANYESIKKQLFSKGGPEADKGVDFNKILTFYELAKTEGEQATNDAREFVAISNGTSLDPHFVVDSFTFDDKSKTFKVDYHVEQILKNNHKVISKNYTKTIAIAQRINFFLADVVDDAKASFGKLIANTLADLQAATDKTLVKIPEISRAVDFQNYVNQAANSQQAIASINAYFKNFSTILTNFTNSKKNALPDNAPIYSFALVRNALTGNYVDVNSQGIVTFYLQTSLSPIAKRDLTNIENKNLTYVDAISIAKVTDSQVASYFTSAQDILGNIDLTFNKTARRTTLAAQSSARAAGTTTTVSTATTAQTKEISQTTAFDFLSELQKGLPFASTLKARQDYIKQLVNLYTKNGLSFAFNGDLTNFYNAGAFGEANQESQTGLSYTFLDKDIAVVPTSTGDFAVSLPVKIELKNSFFGGSDETVVASKEIAFELTGFKTNANISQEQQNLAFKPVASSTATAKKIEPIVLPEQDKRLVYNLDPSPYSRFVYNLNPYLSQDIKDGISGQQAASASQGSTLGTGGQQEPTAATTTTPTDDDEKGLSYKEKQLAETLLANAWGHFTKSSAPVLLEEIKALVSGNKNDALYKLFSNRAGYSYDFGTTNAYVNAWTSKTKFPTLEQISKFAKDETDFASESHIGSLDTTDFFAKPADVAAFYGYLAEQGPARVASYLLQLAQSWGVVGKDVNVAQKIKEFQANPGNVFAKAFAIKGKNAGQASGQPQSQQPESKILSFNKQYLDLHNQGFYSSLVLPKKAEEIVKKAFGLESNPAQNSNVTKSDSDILKALQSSKDQLDLIDGNQFSESGTDFAKHAKDQKNIDRPDGSSTTKTGTTTTTNYQGFKTFGDVLIAFYIKALQFNNFAPFSAIDSKLIAKPTFTNFVQSVNDDVTKKLFESKMYDDEKYAAIDYYYTFGYANDKGEIEKPLFVTPTKTIIFNVSSEETTTSATKVSELDKAIVSIPIYYQNATVDNFDNQFFANNNTDTSASGASQDSTENIKWIDNSATHTLATVLGQQGKDLESYVATHYPNYQIMINPKVETDKFNSNKKVITLALQEITPASTESKPSAQASIVTGQTAAENASQTESSTASQESQTAAEPAKAKTITQTLPITKNQQSRNSDDDDDDDDSDGSAGTSDKHQQSSGTKDTEAKTTEAQPEPQPKPTAPQIPISSLYYKIYVSVKPSQSTTE